VSEEDTDAGLGGELGGIESQAETRLEDAAKRTAQRLGYTRDDSMHITVGTLGMWTDRLATEVEHRLLAKDPGGVLWWFDALAPSISSTPTS
jgi:hypothetical protein